MNAQKTRQFRRAVHDWCNKQELPPHLWNKAWKRFKKIYKKDHRIREHIDNNPYKALSELFTLKSGKNDDKKTTPEKHTSS